MSIRSLRALSLALSLAAGADLTAGTSAFERAARDDQGRVIVENLIIGCSTHPGVQEAVARRFAPAGRHRHRAEDWVSFDRDPEMRPDIVGDIEQIDKHIGRITGMVYIEHLNDCHGRDLGVAYTYQAELVRKLFQLMAPGAELYMDYYLAYLLIDAPIQGLHFLHWQRSPYIACKDNGVQPWTNPFWFQATWEHFLEAIQPDSTFDDFGGRAFVIRHYMDEVREHKELMERVPKDLRQKGEELELGRFLARRGELHLNRLLAEGDKAALVDAAKVFYGARMIPDVVGFLVETGFTDARLRMAAENPFNGRKGEWMLVGSKPRVAAGALESKGSLEGPLIVDRSDREGRR